jgi:chitodextrinase
VIDTTSPSIPTNVTVASKTDRTVSVTWSAATDNIGVTGYEVFRNGAKVAMTSSTSYSDNGLNASTSYTYSVKALDAAGNSSELSEVLSVTTNPAPPSNMVTIYYKQGFAKPFIHYRPVGGSWTTAPGVLIPTSEVGGYNKITINMGTSTQLEACFNNGSSLWDSNNTKNYKFGAGTFTFVPSNSGGSGVISSGVPSTVVVEDKVAPTVPQGLKATSKTESTVNITWTASTDNVAVKGYYIYRNENKVANASTTSFKDTGLSSNKTYYYSIRAYDAAGNESSVSSILPVKTNAKVDTIAPTAPSDLEVSSINQTSIILEWESSKDNVRVVGYEIYQNGVKVGTTSEKKRLVNGLVRGTSYTFYIRAFDAAGNLSSASKSVTAKTKN